MSVPEPTDPLEPFLEKQGFVVLDGGLATELEARGRDIDDPLWSAKVLLEEPDLIAAVHRDYLVAGADCIISASYQASIEGFESRGLTRAEAIDTLAMSVDLALAARDEFWSDPKNRTNRLEPVVAAGVGPYGAYLADGSEYDGKYGLSCEELVAFHRDRWHVLADAGADLIACETIPSLVEARALVALMHETPEMPCMCSFSCRDSERLYDGNLLSDAVAALEAEKQVVALGVNCISPSLVLGIIELLRRVTAKPVAVYPNSGEHYDAATKRWFGVADPLDFGVAAGRWHARGAKLIGGCCRTGPYHVTAMREALSGRPKSEG